MAGCNAPIRCILHHFHGSIWNCRSVGLLSCDLSERYVFLGVVGPRSMESFPVVGWTHAEVVLHVTAEIAGGGKIEHV